jgi:hypothetical protein
MKKLLLVLALVGCGGSSSEMCFPVGGGAKYCVSDAACKIQTGGEVLCAEGSDYGSILTAINEKTGEMQLCVKDKTTEKIKCFDPATECTIDGGAVSCQRTNFMQEDPCFEKPCTGECATCGVYTWCASSEDMVEKVGTCVNACEFVIFIRDKLTDDACAAFPTCPVCICFTANRQVASYDENSGKYSECKNDIGRTTTCNELLSVKAKQYLNEFTPDTRFEVANACSY